MKMRRTWEGLTVGWMFLFLAGPVAILLAGLPGFFLIGYDLWYGAQVSQWVPVGFTVWLVGFLVFLCLNIVSKK